MCRQGQAELAPGTGLSDRRVVCPARSFLHMAPWTSPPAHTSSLCHTPLSMQTCSYWIVLMFVEFVEAAGSQTGRTLAPRPLHCCVQACSCWGVLTRSLWRWWTCTSRWRTARATRPSSPRWGWVDAGDGWVGGWADSQGGSRFQGVMPSGACV